MKYEVFERKLGAQVGQTPVRGGVAIKASLKLAIVGTRNPDVIYQEWEKLLLDKINPDEIQMVISGGAKGIDAFAKLFAARHHKPYMEFAPQYGIYGRYATLKRNTQIVK